MPKQTLADLDLQYLLLIDNMPDLADCQLWVDSALLAAGNIFTAPPLMTLRFVDVEESRALNKQWRQQDKATNVLSFPIDTPLGITEHTWLGDLIFCVPVIAEEIQQQHKHWQAHWAHMIIHGVLHLLGYDHLQTKEAEAMEVLEIQILDQLNYPDPYNDPI